MASERDLSVHCGLHRRGCIPSRRALFAASDERRALADDLGLRSCAELKSRTDEAFAQYPASAAVLEKAAVLCGPVPCRLLEKTAGLRRPVPCRLGGGKAFCATRGCARGRGLEGRWECSDRLGCGFPAPLWESHLGSIDRNLGAIAERGPGS